MVDRSGAHRSVDDRRQNVRTALVLATIALVFFVGVIVRHWLLPL